MSSFMSLKALLRQPEYTGENRCPPCTIVNGLIGFCASVLLGVVVTSVWTGSLGAIVFGLALISSACTIWLRGYLIPGTPELTKQYMPTRVLKWFGKDVPQSIIDDPADIELERVLLKADVLEPCPEQDDLCLMPAFDQAWMTELTSVPTEPDPQILFDQLGMVADNLTIVEYDDAVAAINQNGRQISQWPSPTALRLDIAVAPLLADRIPEWGLLSLAARSQLTAAVRIFLEECPENGPVEVSSETVESCCSSYEVITVICADTGDRLFEQKIQ